jgi:hypothetical protein
LVLTRRELLASGALALPAPLAAAAANLIARENALPGSTDWRLVEPVLASREEDLYRRRKAIERVLPCQTVMCVCDEIA